MNLLEWRRRKGITATLNVINITKYVNDVVDNDELLNVRFAITYRDKLVTSEEKKEKNILHNKPAFLPPK